MKDPEIEALLVEWIDSGFDDALLERRVLDLKKQRSALAWPDAESLIEDLNEDIRTFRAHAHEEAIASMALSGFSMSEEYPELEEHYQAHIRGEISDLELERLVLAFIETLPR